MMRRSSVCLGLVLVSCSVDLALRDDAEVLCDSSNRCPLDWVCNGNGRCVSPEALAQGTPGVRLTQTQGLEVSELGSTASFGVVLTSRPTASVTMRLATSDETEVKVEPNGLVFTPESWSTAQNVTLRGQPDCLTDGAVTSSVFIGPLVSADTDYAAMLVPDLTVTTLDDASTKILIGPINVTTTEAGGTTTVTFTMLCEPTANVTLGVSSSRTAEATVNQPTVMFTLDDWAAPRSVLLSGQNDDVDDGDQPYTLVTAPLVSDDPAYSGIDLIDVAGVNIDDDVANVVVVVPEPRVTSESGASVPLTVVLGSEPLEDVEVTLSTSLPTEATVTPALLLFTPANWNTAQNATVTGVNDPVADGDRPYTLDVIVESGDPVYDAFIVASVPFVNQDNDSPAVRLSKARTFTTTEGGRTTDTYAVTLATAPSASVTVTIASADTTLVSASPATLTFTAGDWNVGQVVTVTGLRSPSGYDTSAIRHDAASGDPDYNGTCTTCTNLVLTAFHTNAGQAHEMTTTGEAVLSGSSPGSIDSWSAADTWCSVYADMELAVIAVPERPATPQRPRQPPRRACTTPGCATHGADEHENWPLEPNTVYLRAEDRRTIVGKTNALALFDTLVEGLPGGLTYWTGLNSDWTSGDQSNNCIGWESSNNQHFGRIGSGGTTSVSTTFAGGRSGCGEGHELLCVK